MSLSTQITNTMAPLAGAGILAAALTASNPASAQSVYLFGAATGGQAIGGPTGKPAGMTGIRFDGGLGSKNTEDDNFGAVLRWNAMGIFSAGGVSHVSGDRSFGTRLCGGLTGVVGYLGNTSFGFQADLDLCGGFSYLQRTGADGQYGALVGALWRTGLAIAIDRADESATFKAWKIVPGIMGMFNFWGLSPESSVFNPTSFEKSGLVNVPGPKIFPFLELGARFN